MSGHSKWATIKRKKAVTDAKRGKIFTTIIKEITIAARDGGGEIDSNPRLRQAVSNAKSANMPSDNITRAIKKGTGELPGVTYEEVSYEGYGPAGVAIFMECLTDNKQRTVAEIRHLISKYGGNLGENGSVSWMFDKKGQITLKANGHEEDVVFEVALEAGAEDFEAADNVFIISTGSSEIMSVRDALDSQGYEVESANIDMVPKNLHNVDSGKEQSVITLLEALEDHDDIKSVYTNFDSED